MGLSMDAEPGDWSVTKRTGKSKGIDSNWRTNGSLVISLQTDDILHTFDASFL